MQVMAPDDRTGIFGLTIDVFSYQRLQDKGSPLLATVQIHEVRSPASYGGSFSSLKRDLLRSLREKIFIPGSVSCDEFSAFLESWTRDFVHYEPSIYEEADGLVLAFHGEDPTHPSGLCPEPYDDHSPVLDAVLEDGRSMACILSGWAAEGLVVGGDGGAAAAVPAAPLQGVRQEQPLLYNMVKPDPDAGRVAFPREPFRGAQAGAPEEEEKPLPQERGRGVKRARQEEGGQGIAPAAGPILGRHHRVVSCPESLTLSVLAELHGEVRLEVPSSTTVGELLDRIQCSEGISPRDRQLFIYHVRHSKDPGAALALSDMAAPLSLYAPPGVDTPPLALLGEVSALKRAREREERRQESERRRLAREAARAAREGLFGRIGGRRDGEFYIFVERVNHRVWRDDVEEDAQQKALALQGTVVIQSLRPDSTVQALMAEVEQKLGIQLNEQLLFCGGRLLQRRKGDPSPIGRPFTLFDEIEHDEDRPPCVPSRATERKPPGAPLTLLDYRIDPDSVVRVMRLAPEPSSHPSMRSVLVKDLNGRSYTIPAERTDTVAMVKLRIQECVGPPVDQQRLIYDGMQLIDGCLLAEYDIGMGATLYLALRLRGS